MPGQLGLGATDASVHSTPTQVPGVSNIIAIAAGSKHSTALALDGTVYVWGANDHLEAGCAALGVTVASPNQLMDACTGGAPVAGVVQIAAGGAFNLALLADGTVRAWGDNTYGQLGNGTTGTDSAVPVTVIDSGTSSALSGVARIAAGANHALALKPNTRVAAWGRNNAGQLGDASLTDRNQAVEVRLNSIVSTKAVALIAAGRQHSLIQYETGPVASFGDNSFGQLGRTLSSGTCPSSPNDQCYAVEMSPHYPHAAGVFAGPTADRSFVYIPGDGLFGRFEVAGLNASAEAGIGLASVPLTTPAPVTEVVQVGDKIGKRTNFRTDASRSDVFWRNTNDGSNAIWDYTTSGAMGFTPAFPQNLGTDWSLLGTGDVDGDGRSDVIWRATSTGQVAVWLMSGAGSIASVTFPGVLSATQWELAGVGDLDGDGHADILWRDTGTGQVRAWYMGLNGQLDVEANVGPVVSYSAWSIKGLGDVNGDGIQDIIWFHPSDGVVAVWRMAPTGTPQFLFPGAVGAASTWQITKVGDFDGDGRDDLFWRNTSDGTNAVWYFKGGNTIESADFFVGTPIAQWRLDVTGDYDGDGREDLMWYDVTSGATVRWLMQGRGVTPTYQTVTGIGLGWQAMQ